MIRKIAMILMVSVLVLCMATSCGANANSSKELTESVTQATDALKSATQSIADGSREELQKAQSELEALRAENAAMKAEAEKTALEAQAALEKAQNEARLAQLEAEKAQAEVQQAQAEAAKANTEAQAVKVAAATQAATSSKTGLKTTGNSAPIMSLNMTSTEDISSAVNKENAAQTQAISNKIDSVAATVSSAVNSAVASIDLKDDLNKVSNDVSATVIASATAVTNAVNSAVESVDLSEDFASVNRNVSSSTDVLSNKIDTLANKVSETVITATDNLANKTQIQTNQAKVELAEKIDKLSNNVGSAASSYASVTRTAVEDAKNEISKTVNDLSQNVTTAADGYAADTKAAVDNAKSETVNAISVLSVAAQREIDEATSKIQASYNQAAGALDSLTESLAAAESELQASAQDAVATVVASVNTNTDQAVDKAVATINSAVEDGIAKINDAFRALMDEYNLPKKKIKKTTDSEPAKLVNLSLEEFNAQQAAQEEKREEVLASNAAAAEAAAKAAAEKPVAPAKPILLTPVNFRNRTAVIGNDNRVVDVNSDLFKKVQALFVALGLTSPSTTGPWTVSQLEDLIAMAGIPEMNIQDASVKDLYDQVLAGLESETTFDFGFVKINLMNLDVNFALYGLYNGSNYPVTKAMLNERLSDIVPVVSTGAEFYLGPYFYSMVKVGLKDDAGSDLANTWANNLSFLINRKFNKNMLDYSFLISYGVGNFSLMVGHDYLDWNNYKTGSMVLSPVTKLNFVQASFYDNAGKFTFTEAKSGSHWVSAAKAEYNRNDRVNVSLSFINAYKNVFDVFKNPVIALDIDFAAAGNLNIYAQGAVTTSVAKYKGYGVMAGYKWVIPAEKGIFTVTGEAQYMAKGLYSKNFYFGGNGLFNNSAKFLLTPDTVGSVTGALYNLTNSFATVNESVNFSNDKFSVNADLITVFLCNADPEVFKQKVTANIKLKLHTTVNLMPGVGVFGGASLYTWSTEGANTGVDGFAGVKISL